MKLLYSIKYSMFTHSERVKRGLERAKAKGKRLGRPVIHHQRDKDIIEMRHEGYSYREIAFILKMTKGAVQRAVERSRK